jgi:putative glutamine amidotransferase
VNPAEAIPGGSSVTPIVAAPRRGGSRPVVLIACSHAPFELAGIGTIRYQSVFERYVDAVVSVLDCIPVLVPALGGSDVRAREYAQLADGAVLPGAISNVAPELYGGAFPEDEAKRDPLRDATTLPLVRAALEEGLPVLGICRGLQEINVALGGTLHQRVHELPGRLDHRAPQGRTFAERYSPSHDLIVKAGSWLERILVARGVDPRTLRVNSLHGQAADTLGRSIVAEATAPDGTVEAIRVTDAKALTLGVQWHAEWYVRETPLHAAVFDEFRGACLARHALRTGIARPEHAP